jgi:hypothetical protein
MGVVVGEPDMTDGSKAGWTMSWSCTCAVSVPILFLPLVLVDDMGQRLFYSQLRQPRIQQLNYQV